MWKYNVATAAYICKLHKNIIHWPLHIPTYNGAIIVNIIADLKSNHSDR